MKITLTLNELEILRKLAEGVREEQLAQNLHLKKQVIVDLKKTLLRKVGVQNPLKAFQLLAKKGFEIRD